MNTIIEELNKRTAYIKNKPIVTPEQKSNYKQVNCAPMEHSHKIRIASTYRSGDKSEIELGDTLLKLLIGFYGSTARINYGDTDIPVMLERGQFWYADKIKFMRGEPGHCHANSCRIWLENPDELVICTGYALTSDGIWVEHTWCVWVKARVNKIVETTVGREAYFGYAMTPEECEQFVHECL